MMYFDSWWLLSRPRLLKVLMTLDIFARNLVLYSFACTGFLFFLFVFEMSASSSEVLMGVNDIEWVFWRLFIAGFFVGLVISFITALSFFLRYGDFVEDLCEEGDSCDNQSVL